MVHAWHNCEHIMAPRHAQLKSNSKEAANLYVGLWYRQPLTGPPDTIIFVCIVIITHAHLVIT